MLIGRDDISDDLSRGFQCMFTLAQSRSFPPWKRRSCKLSFLFSPCRQSALETFLAGYLFND